jgi:AraC family transcriptional regulator, positive regulator of tynA and feaB
MSLITTDALPARQRFEYWREVVARQYIETRLEPCPGAFHASVEAQAVGGLVAARSICSGGWAFRTDAEIARSPASFYMANIHLGGPVSVSAGREPMSLAAGDIFFVDALRAFELGGRDAFRCMALVVPKVWIDSRLARPDLVHGSVVRREAPFARILSGYVLTALETAEQMTDDAASLFAMHSVELMLGALGQIRPGSPASTDAVHEALFTRACRIIDFKCSDSTLAPASIASELGISVRLLHRLFAERGKTAMKTIFAERVSRAAKLLADPNAAHRSITEIAFACGFNDSTHFGRAFAARMHMPPSEWRKQVFG